MRKELLLSVFFYLFFLLPCGGCSISLQLFNINSICNTHANISPSRDTVAITSMHNRITTVARIARVAKVANDAGTAVLRFHFFVVE